MVGISFEQFERIVFDEIVSRRPDCSAILAWQYEAAHTEKRVFTDYGFYTVFVVPDDAVTAAGTIEALPQDLQLRRRVHIPFRRRRAVHRRRAVR